MLNNSGDVQPSGDGVHDMAVSAVDLGQDVSLHGSHGQSDPNSRYFVGATGTPHDSGKTWEQINSELATDPSASNPAVIYPSTPLSWADESETGVHGWTLRSPAVLMMSRKTVRKSRVNPDLKGFCDIFDRIFLTRI